MQLRTERRVMNVGEPAKPVISLSISPKNPSGYLIVGLGLGVVFGFILGSFVGMSMGDKSLLMVQGLWNKLFNVNADGQRVHFELLLQ